MKSSSNRHVRACATAAPLLLAAFTIQCDRGAPAENPPGPVLVTSPGEELCPHPYFPLVEGAEWTYELGSGPREERTKTKIAVRDIARRGAAISAKLQRGIGQGTLTAEGACNREGVSFLGAFVPLRPPIPSHISVSPRITKRTGMLIPKLSSFRPNTDWTYSFTAHTEIRGSHPLTMDSEWQVEAAYLGEGQVTVPAGRYDVARVRFTVTVHHRPPEEEGAVMSDRAMDPPPMTFVYSLARGAGVVLVEGEPVPGRSARARWELVGLSSGGSNEPSAQ